MIAFSINESHFLNEFIKTKPKDTFFHYFSHSYRLLDMDSDQTNEIWHINKASDNKDYPTVNKSSLWYQFRQQRITTINFWYLLTHHAFSLISY